VGKPHSIGEHLLLPATKDVVKTMFSEKFPKDIDLIHLSNNTVSRRINDLADNVESQLIKRVKARPYYALKIDETTDVAYKAQLMCYVRYGHDNNIHDDVFLIYNFGSYIQNYVVRFIMRKMAQFKSNVI
jgi:hypothetical protein